MKAAREFIRRYWLPLLVIVALCNVLGHHFWSVASPEWRPDVRSYFHAFEVLSGGSIDPFRTPLYPALLGLASLLGPALSTAAVVVFQNGLYLLSVWLLGRIAREGFGLPVRACILGVAPYCVFALYPMYASLLLTDGIGASMAVIAVWLFMKLLQKPSAARTAIAALMLLLLPALRPSFLYMPVALLLAMPLLLREGLKAQARAWAVCAGICVLAIGAYAAAYHHRTGHAGVSSVGALNEAMMHLVLDSEPDPGRYPVHAGLEELARHPDLDDILKWDLYFHAASDSVEALYEEVADFKAEHPGAWLESRKILIPANLRDGFLSGLVPVWLLPLTLAAYLALIAIWTFSSPGKRSFGEYFRKESFSLPFRAFIWLMVCGNLGVVMLGSPGDYPRLLMPSFPFVFLILADMAAFALSLFRSLKR